MWLISAKWLVLWSLWAARLVPQPTLPVHTRSGTLRGVISPAGDHVSYTGITYATVEKRFQAPGPAPSWDGVFNAFDENIICHQTTFSYIIGQEDCLKLNVYTPLNTVPESKLPVMVFIHGGGYFQGSGTPSVYGPRYLVNKGVILVTLNYRLNIQGFLCLGIREAPGNAGMKDMVAALRWVRDNIEAFGGDPGSVTIFGESAGAASVSYIVLSSMAKGLFHRAITQSGSALSPWAYQFKPVYLASLLAKAMLYETQDPHKLYKYFMTKTDDELILTRVPRQIGNIIISEILYTPCTENIIDGVEPFLTESPYDVLANGNFNKVPMMMGTMSEEGIFLVNMENDTMFDLVDFEKALPKNLEIRSDNIKKEIAGNLRSMYMENEKINDPLKLSKFYGEPNFVSPMLEEVELMLKSTNQPIYTYIFDYSGWRNIIKMSSRKPLNIPRNATHADDLFYLFSQDVIPSFLEYDMIERVTTLWTNFAKYGYIQAGLVPSQYKAITVGGGVSTGFRLDGNPTPRSTKLLPLTWKPVDPASPRSLVIDKQFYTLPMWWTESSRYLREVYAKYRRRR